ncbi:hypothetical protein MRB53_028345 [Persea americana]|uniref:Uncharacterized protein n=1 Tax=Persea americana TaxID=3435 RepID=A0ACC2KFF7_PERAE|nr:hypothetical protein MRB53_028345 [Persea americana]
MGHIEHVDFVIKNCRMKELKAEIQMLGSDWRRPHGPLGVVALLELEFLSYRTRRRPEDRRLLQLLPEEHRRAATPPSLIVGENEEEGRKPQTHSVCRTVQKEKRNEEDLL